MEWTVRNKETVSSIKSSKIQNGEYSISIDGVTYSAKILHKNKSELTLLINESEIVNLNIIRSGNKCAVGIYGKHFEFDLLRGSPEANVGNIANLAQSNEVIAPMPGKIVEILVKVGSKISAGEPVCIIEAMKMQNELTAPIDGTVAEIFALNGTVVEANTLLIKISADGN